MDDREKLIELMKYNSCISIYGVVDPDVNIVVNWEDIADEMVANGVIIQKEAEWVKVGYKWMCTNCHSKISLDGTPAENNLFYCSHCGAKMKEVK